MVAVLSLCAGPASVTVASPPAEGDLQSRLAEIESQIAALKSAEGENWLTEARATEIRALVSDVLLDADTRASLLADNGTAGHDGKFYLQDAEGNFRLNVGGTVQFRYVLNMQDDEAADDGDTTRSGFENRRTKVEFSGHVVDPSWQYKVRGAFDRSSGSMILEDAYIAKVCENGWTLTLGQVKPPFLREELMSSSRQLAVDRSLVNEERNQDWAQGVQVAYQGDQVRVAAMFHDGFVTRNTPALMYDTEFALTGRAEVLVDGEWSQFDDFTSWRGGDFGLMLGGAAHYEKAEYGTTAGPEEEEFMWTADASVEFGGANLFGYIVGRHLEEADADRLGAVVQGGFFFTDSCELFARYEWYDFDASSVEDLSVITVGVNKYWNKHALKWTTDVGFGLDQVNPVFAQSGVGWRGDVADEDGQIVIRSQVQLLF
jgi:hypothetical protein